MTPTDEEGRKIASPSGILAFPRGIIAFPLGGRCRRRRRMRGSPNASAMPKHITFALRANISRRKATYHAAIGRISRGRRPHITRPAAAYHVAPTAQHTTQKREPHGSLFSLPPTAFSTQKPQNRKQNHTNLPRRPPLRTAPFPPRSLPDFSHARPSHQPRLPPPPPPLLPYPKNPTATSFRRGSGRFFHFFPLSRPAVIPSRPPLAPPKNARKKSEKNSKKQKESLYKQNTLCYNVSICFPRKIPFQAGSG